MHMSVKRGETFIPVAECEQWKQGWSQGDCEMIISDRLYARVLQFPSGSQIFRHFFLAAQPVEWKSPYIARDIFHQRCRILHSNNSISPWYYRENPPSSDYFKIHTYNELIIQSKVTFCIIIFFFFFFS